MTGLPHTASNPWNTVKAWRAGCVTLELTRSSTPMARAREYRVKAEGSQAAKNAAVLSELVALVAFGELEVPIGSQVGFAGMRPIFLQDGAERGPVLSFGEPGRLAHVLLTSLRLARGTFDLELPAQLFGFAVGWVNSRAWPE
jgi:hypothetical protein